MIEPTDKDRENLAKEEEAVNIDLKVGKVSSEETWMVVLILDSLDPSMLKGQQLASWHQRALLKIP